MLKQLAGQTAIYGVGTIVPRFLNYLLFPYLTRLMTTGEYGVVTDLYALIPFALVVLTMIKGRSGYERDGSFSTPLATHWQSFDAGIAAQTFCLSAHALGLGTVIMGIYDPAEVAKVVEIPEGQEVAALIALGHPAQDPQAPARKDVDTLLRFE